MTLLFSKREVPNLDTEAMQMRYSRHLATALYAVTHGLWLLTSLAGLMFTITDALPASRQILLVSQILE